MLFKISDFRKHNQGSRYKDSYLRRFLPMKPSKNLAEIAAALMTDGHIELHKGTRPKKIVFYSDNRNGLEWFSRIIKKVFLEQGKIVEYVPIYGVDTETTRLKYVLNNAAVARFLIMIGVPGSDKTKQIFDVPNWVKDGSIHMKRAFLQRLLDFDGSIPCKKKGRRATWNIQFYSTKHKDYLKSGHQYFESIMMLLKEFGIESKLYIHKINEEKYTFMLTVLKQESMLTFAKYIGYKDRVKQKRLMEAKKNILENISFKNKELCDLLSEYNLIMGSDKKCVKMINRSIGKEYSNRMYEHWRRNEIKVPFPVIKYLCTLMERDVNQFIDIPKDILY